MRFLFLTIFFVSISFSLTAQMPQQAQKINIGHIYGKVIDSKTKKPMGYTAVAILTQTDSLIDGQLTEDNGDFSIEKLPLGNLKLRITSVGYTTILKNVMISMNNADQDVGNLAMSASETELKEAVITADRSAVELKQDRKVVNVDQYANSKGGTAMDVIKNVPGIAVDANGNVSIRNNTPYIYIDGKPSQLTLDQIPADQIDRVEIITNPSAKFDATATGGILNVILKKNSKPGYNGIINFSVGTNNQYNGMALLNLRMKKFGFNVSYNLNSSVNNPHTFMDRKNFDNTGAVESSAYQDMLTKNGRTFHNARVGFDWYINNRNTLSIAENATFGRFVTDATQKYNSKDGSGNITQNGTRENDQTANFNNFTTSLDFKHTYAKTGKEWSLSLMYTHNFGGNNYLNTTNAYDPQQNFLPDSSSVQKIESNSTSNQLVAQWDMTNPLPKNGNLDFGVRITYNRTNAFQGTQDRLANTNTFENDSALSFNYTIDDFVGAAYITYGQTVNKFSYQVGFRYEHTYYAAHTPTATYEYMYPQSIGKIYESLFPSLNMSYTFDKKNQLQFNVSRKVTRPNFFQRAPFMFVSDRYNVREGNPLLRPEFDSQAELNYNLTLQPINFLSSIYARYQENPITDYVYPLPNDQEVLMNTFANANYGYSYGWENTIHITAVKNLDISLNGNVYHTYIGSIQGGLTAANSGWTSFFKGTISYKFPLDITAQVNATYMSPRYLPQGRDIQMYFLDFSVTKDFMKVLTVNFTLSDIANSKINGEEYNTPQFYQLQTKRREVRFARLGVSFKFGKMDASMFKKNSKKQAAPQGGMDMGF